MSSDNSDKTVFRQSAPGRTGKIDATVVRPTPGRRGSQHHTAEHGSSPQHEQRASMPHASPAYHESYSGQFSTTYGLNPLINAASMLIAVFNKTRQSVSHPNVGGLHQHLVAAIRGFEDTAKAKHYKPEIVLSARYILCAALDEAVLNTPWGAESAWTQRTLLSIFHNETNGGEKFFQLLDRMKAYPADNLDILELMYLLLSLGFEGKYRVVSRGRDKVEQIRDDLHRLIRLQRGEYERSLSQSWQGLGKTRNTLAQYIPMWVISSVAIGVLVLSYSGFRYWLHKSTEATASQLTSIALSASEKDKNNK
ncbi:MAG: DotU family type IV/VI secretion system protein [Gammaproteobacteria bacterium]|nr:DotU family type IV/VI secretion system protein [Gammaproteobacteria bacterium]